MSGAVLELPPPFAIGYGKTPLARVQRSLSIEGGREGAASITLLAGDNGTGKTTLLRTLAGLLPAVEGRAFLDGKPLEAWRRAGAICYLAETLEWDGALTPKILFQSLAENPRAALDAAARLSIPLSKPFFKLSKGNRQKVRVALAVAAQARLTLLDEPFSGLDIASREVAMELLRGIFSDPSKRLVISLHTEKIPNGWSDSSIGIHHGVLETGPAFGSVYEARAYFFSPASLAAVNATP